MPSRYFIDTDDDVVDALIVYSQLHRCADGESDEVRNGARAALESLIERGLHYESRAGRRCFDGFAAIEMVADQLRVSEHPLWWDGAVASYRGRVERLERACADASDGAARFEVHLRREISAAQWPPGSRVRFGVLLPVEGATQRDIQIEEAKVSDGFRLVRDVGCLDVRGVAEPGRRSVHVEVRLSLTACRWTPPAAAEAVDDPAWTSLDDGVVRVTEAIAALSRRLAPPDRTTPADALEAFWTYLFDRVRCGYVHYDTLDPAAPLDSVLEAGWADCRLASCLLIAMCRARGIPARLLGGYQLYQTAPAEHWWCEVALPERGWIPVDYGSWVLAGGRVSDPWSRRWLGALEPRVVVHRLPYRIPLGLGVRLPPHFHSRQRLDADGGGVLTYLDGQTGELLYRDHVRVSTLGSAAARAPASR